MLHHQLASLYRHPTQHEVLLWVCYSLDDPATSRVLRYWREKRGLSSNVGFVGYNMPLSRLFRRAIGRNEILLREYSRSNAFWLLDADYFFGEGCLDALGFLIATKKLPRIATVGEYHIHKTHAIGDALLAATGLDCDPPHWKPDGFEVVQNKRAIGGLQIISDVVAAVDGYLNGSKWMKPVPTEHGFLETICDRKAMLYHEKLGRTWEKISLPNLFRIRHSTRGATGTYRRKRPPTSEVQT